MSATCEHLDLHIHAHTSIYKLTEDGDPQSYGVEIRVFCRTCLTPFRVLSPLREAPEGRGRLHGFWSIEGSSNTRFGVAMEPAEDVPPPLQLTGAA